MRKAKERTIYNNYSLWEDYKESAREVLLETNENTVPTENDLWDIIHMWILSTC